MKGRRYGHPYTSDEDAMVQLHRPSLSEMTLNYDHFTFTSAWSLRPGFCIMLLR
nr:MAG TPA: hypothetical protein [Caudoviricetes sp.]